MSHWEANGKSDEWYTPKYIFDALQTRFDVDVAAPEDRTYCSVPAAEFITQDSLSKIWTGYVWMNPPFGGRNSVWEWITKLQAHGNGIALTADRTSAPWWQDAVAGCSGVLFINGKVKFIRPDGSMGKSPSNGTTLIAYGTTANEALYKAQTNGLGILL
jgi:hypothetical protein